MSNPDKDQLKRCLLRDHLYTSFVLSMVQQVKAKEKENKTGECSDKITHLTRLQILSELTVQITVLGCAREQKALKCEITHNYC